MSHSNVYGFQAVSLLELSHLKPHFSLFFSFSSPQSSIFLPFSLFFSFYPFLPSVCHFSFIFPVSSHSTPYLFPSLSLQFFLFILVYLFVFFPLSILPSPSLFLPSNPSILLPHLIPRSNFYSFSLSLTLCPSLFLYSSFPFFPLPFLLLSLTCSLPFLFPHSHSQFSVIP